MRFFMPKNVGAICTSGLLAVNRQKTLKQKENVNMKENAKTEPLKYRELRELEAKYPEYSRYKILALSLMRYGAVLDREAEKRRRTFYTCAAFRRHGSWRFGAI